MQRKEPRNTRDVQRQRHYAEEHRVPEGLREAAHPSADEQGLPWWLDGSGALPSYRTSLDQSEDEGALDHS